MAVKCSEAGWPVLHAPVSKISRNDSCMKIRSICWDCWKLQSYVPSLKVLTRSKTTMAMQENTLRFDNTLRVVVSYIKLPNDTLEITFEARHFVGTMYLDYILLKHGDECNNEGMIRAIHITNLYIYTEQIFSYMF